MGHSVIRAAGSFLLGPNENWLWTWLLCWDGVRFSLRGFFSYSIRNERSRINVERGKDDASRRWDIRNFHGDRLCDQMLTVSITLPTSVNIFSAISPFERLLSFKTELDA